MESKVEVLEAMFQKAESDLNFLSRRLDFEFDQNNEENKANPTQMLQKIADIKKEFSSIVQEATAIQETQKATVAQFQSQLLAACQLLQKVQEQGNLQSEDKPEELVKLEELLGVSFPHHQSVPTTFDTQQEANQSDPVNNNLTFTLNAKNPVEVKETEANEALTPLERRSQSSEFIEVSEEEFESVSSLVRGRVKLSEVNMTYRILWRHFKEEENSNPVGPSEMYKMGLKVAGATGETKLKVLRALKLCTISSKMEVKLV
ncbi:spindle and kinetochore-associated protein 2-like isoform X2 [Ostrea edulis]|uniref:spindle and kinetochore-associated protein 2-like isoform X2 n=1 Tax=Ostrea edulis TaxID=37623 RepID=UPI0024AFAA30|nr:spindle and kinetochore-associated protein 2-like isoform X2 [Ostrea edulis]